MDDGQPMIIDAPLIPNTIVWLDASLYQMPYQGRFGWQFDSGQANPSRLAQSPGVPQAESACSAVSKLPSSFGQRSPYKRPRAEAGSFLNNKVTPRASASFPRSDRSFPNRRGR